MNAIKTWIINAFVGKNAASWGRSVSTWLGGLLLASALFSSTPAPIDPSLGDAVVAVQAPLADQVTDGLTVEEGFRAGAGLLLIWLSRLISWFRARKLDWLANAMGFLIGRSADSAIRAAMTAVSGLLTYIGYTGGLKGHLGELAGAVILYVVARLYSAAQDSKANPVPAK